MEGAARAVPGDRRELPELLTPTGRKSRNKCSIIGQIGGGKRLSSGVIDIALAPALFEKGDLPGE